MAITNVKSYNNSNPNRFNLLREKTKKYLDGIRAIEEKIRSSTPGATTDPNLTKVHTCQLLAEAFSGKLQEKQTDFTSADTLALSFTESIGSNDLLDYDVQASFFSPRLAVCIYFFDCMQDSTCLNHLKELNLVPKDFLRTDPIIQHAMDLLGLVVIFNTMDRPFRYLETIIGFGAGAAAWAAVALTITAVIAGMGALAISFPFFAIPAAVCAAIFIGGYFLYEKVASKNDNDMAEYKNILQKERDRQTDNFNWSTFFQNNDSDDTNSNQLLHAIDHIVVGAKQSEQFKHIEFRK